MQKKLEVLSNHFQFRVPALLTQGNILQIIIIDEQFESMMDVA